MLLDFARCPDCYGTLSTQDDQALVCESCGETYPIVDGIPQLVGTKSAINTSEVETQDYVTDFYENLRYKLPWARAYHEHTLREMLALADVTGRVLDNGCGNGMFLERLVQDSRPGTQLIGTDISMGMLEHAKRRLTECGSAISVTQADACRLPFADDSFDLVFARGLLHHLPDPAAGAREMARVLRPGGVVIALDPNRTLISELPRRLLRGTSHFDEDHKNFTVRQMRRILTPHLRVDGVHHVGYVAYPLLGFPDITNFGKVLPLGALAPSLMKLDDVLARVPGVRALSWGLMVRAVAD
jgi:ubiquinone/menaquinone biosynthesis C-methylase UbiE